jgi:hypothetical protein
MSQRKPRSSTHPITTSIAIFVTALFLISPANAKTLQLTTYYPAPKAIYDRLNMLPQASTPSTCTIGSMMVDNATGNLLYCHDESGVGTWGSLDNIWKKTNNDIYPTDTATHPLIFMGIGTSTPSFKLTLNNDGGILAMGTFGSGTTITAVDSGRPMGRLASIDLVSTQSCFSRGCRNRRPLLTLWQ